MEEQRKAQSPNRSHFLEQVMWKYGGFGKLRIPISPEMRGPPLYHNASTPKESLGGRRYGGEEEGRAGDGRVIRQTGRPSRLREMGADL